MRPRRSRLSTRSRAAAVVLAALLGIVGVEGAIAQVGVAWTQFQGGPSKTGAADGPAPGYREAWSAPVAPGGPGERFGLSTPVVAGDLIVAVGPDEVTGIELSTGERAFAVERELGPSVPPAVADVGGGLVVYTEGWGDGPPAASGTTDDASPSPSPTGDGDGETGGDEPAAHLAAFDLGSQERPWPPVALDAVSRTGVTVDDAVAYTGTNRGTVVAVDLADGSVAWQQELGALMVTPVTVAGDLVLVGLQGDRDTAPVVVALDAATGEERWRHAPEGAAAVVSSVSADDTTAFAVVSGLSEAVVEAVDLESGETRWSTRLNAAFDITSPPIVGEATVFVTDLVGHTRAFDADDGSERWDFAQNAPTFRSVPALAGDHLLVPAVDGELGVIDVASGELVWRGAADDAPTRGLALTPDLVIAVRGGTASGLVALEHDPDAVLVAEPSPTTPAWGTMVLSLAAAAVPILALTILLGRWLVRRRGGDDVAARTDEPAGGDEGGDGGGGEEPRDPWEDDEEPAP